MFFRAAYPRLLSALTLYTGDRDLAAELAQEALALARAHRRWPSVSAMDSPGGWAHRVAINLANSSLLPTDPAPLDFPAVKARSHELACRRRAVAGGAAVLVVAVATVAFAAGMPSQQPDRLAPAERQSTAPAPPSARSSRIVELLFTTGCGAISPVARRIDGPVLEASLRALFTGPTDEEKARGVASTSGSVTARLLRSVHVQGGSAYVDHDGALRDQVRAGVDGAGSSNFYEQVGGTLRQFGGIAGVYYAYDGDPADWIASIGSTCPVLSTAGGLCDPQSFQSAATPDPSLQDSIKAPSPIRISRIDEFSLLTVVSADTVIAVDLDRVDMLGGTEAEVAARASGDDPYSDDYLVNDNPKLRGYSISPVAVVWAAS